MNILGISAGFHDAGIALICNGEIVFAAHSERYSKQKHDSELNREILADCFAHCGVPDRVAYYERPWLKKTRQLCSILRAKIKVNIQCVKLNVK